MTRPLRRRFFPVDEGKRRARQAILRSMSFSYWAMFRRRGIRLPLVFFFECHLYDITHKTDTHKTIVQAKYDYRPDNFEHGTWYMSSWTSETLNSFNIVRKHLGSAFHEYTFVDVGCGKGKVILVWKEELQKAHIDAKVVGLDYYEPLVKIARNNYRHVFGDGGCFHEVDAALCEYKQFGDRLILYLYNPFGKAIIKTMLAKLVNIPTVIIYNYPLHCQIMIDGGFKVVYEKTGWIQNACTMILTNHVERD